MTRRIPRYVAFAVVATGVNVALQAAVLETMGGPYRLVVAMGAGTAAGLLVKYLLDKHFVFAATTQGAARELRQFARYAATGAVTTAVFWITEAAFAVAFRSEALTLVGACLGLTIGYAAKFLLDRRYVFEGSPA